MVLTQILTGRIFFSLRSFSNPLPSPQLPSSPSTTNGKYVSTGPYSDEMTSNGYFASFIVPIAAIGKHSNRSESESGPGEKGLAEGTALEGERREHGEQERSAAPTTPTGGASTGTRSWTSGTTVQQGVVASGGARSDEKADERV